MGIEYVRDLISCVKPGIVVGEGDIEDQVKKHLDFDRFCHACIKGEFSEDELLDLAEDQLGTPAMDAYLEEAIANLEWCLQVW